MLKTADTPAFFILIRSFYDKGYVPIIIPVSLSLLKKNPP
jgi:hypothetical protein